MTTVQTGLYNITGSGLEYLQDRDGSTDESLCPRTQIVSMINNAIAPVVQYSQPTTGATVTIANNTTNYETTLIIDPAGPILALTIALPSTPTDGQSVSIGTSQAITGVTMTSGATIVAGVTTLALGGTAKYMYKASNTTWFKIG